jgi:large subunit ribosomal protein L31
MALVDVGTVLILSGSNRYSPGSRGRKSTAMKKDIHPDYHFVSVTLADGTKFTTRSTIATEEYQSDVDSTNHPFFTGRRQYVDTAGRVEKYRRRYGTKAGTEDESV